MDVTVETWTPAMAVKALENNVVNRNLRPGVVAAYAKDMNAGLWKMTAEPIKFAKDGSLLDGQHRLYALCEVDNKRKITFLVARGIEPEAQILMDSGASRTAADSLGFLSPHLKNRTQCASLARWLAAAPNPDEDLLLGIKAKVTNGQVVKSYEDHPGIPDAVAHGRAVADKLGVSASSVAYCWYLFSLIDQEKCHQFFYGMADMSWYGEEDPRKSAFRRLTAITREVDAKAGNRTSVMVVSVLTRAWNDWRTGAEPNSYRSFYKNQMIPPVRPV